MECHHTVGVAVSSGLVNGLLETKYKQISTWKQLRIHMICMAVCVEILVGDGKENIVVQAFVSKKKYWEGHNIG